MLKPIEFFLILIALLTIGIFPVFCAPKPTNNPQPIAQATKQSKPIPVEFRELPR